MFVEADLAFERGESGDRAEKGRFAGAVIALEPIAARRQMPIGNVEDLVPAVRFLKVS